jgi:hypothetical protein
MCELGWILYCQRVDRYLHRSNKFNTTRPKGIAKQ